MGLSCPGPRQGQAGLLPSPKPWAPDCLSSDLEEGGRKFTVCPRGKLGRPREGKSLARGHQRQQHPPNCISLTKACPSRPQFPLLSDQVEQRGALLLLRPWRNPVRVLWAPASADTFPARPGCGPGSEGARGDLEGPRRPWGPRDGLRLSLAWCLRGREIPLGCLRAPSEPSPLRRPAV